MTNELFPNLGVTLSHFTIPKHRVGGLCTPLSSGFLSTEKSGQKNWFFLEKKKPYASHLTRAKWQEKPQFSSTKFLQNKYPPFCPKG
jgi:hypothetical protein